MTIRTVKAEHRITVAAVRTALRAVEDNPRRASLAHLDRAIADLPLLVLSDEADHVARLALSMVSEAADSSVFYMVTEMTRVANDMVQGPPPPLPVHTHSATQAAVVLLTRCYAERDGWQQGSPFYRAWDRAVEGCFSALRSVTSYLYGETNALRVARCMDECSAAVRRAVAYRALYTVREALVKVSRCYRLFPIGGRQPLPDSFHGAWTRVLGETTYRFEVTPPDLYGGAPHGWVLVTRMSDGVRVHAQALTGRDWEGQANSRMSVALYRI